MAQTKKEFEEAKQTHARDLAEVRVALKKAEEIHALELTEVREGWKKGEETEAQSALLQARSIVVSR